VHFFNLHLATPRWGLLAAVSDRSDGAKQLQHNSDTRREQSAALSHRARLLAGPVLLAGDFNTPVESTIHREYWSDYQNAFSVAGFGCGSTHLTELTAVRIDHILATADWHIRKCWVGPDVGSAHRPIVADLTRRVGEPRRTAQFRARTTVERR
jgi:endonuclease/exonuclease/phosphatase (EEP) superfamily protein YafD